MSSYQWVNQQQDAELQNETRWHHHCSCMVVAPQTLMTPESHQPAAKQAVVDKSNMDEVMIKDPEVILQTFSVWTAQVRGTIETSRPLLSTDSLCDKTHSPIQCLSQSSCNYLTCKGYHSIVSKAQWTHQHRFTDILAGFTRRPHDVCVFPSSSIRFKGDAETFFPSGIIHSMKVPAYHVEDAESPLCCWVMKPYPHNSGGQG
ncbi:hypothetical protein GRJ2_001456400 [Grus japonensis]|uniref:Uncharacterized protein n=1 Tax=Grus japonensis TaxID=30415 RepID=A0ABC9WWV9_GRUJA